jgi:hypothetical protein
VLSDWLRPQVASSSPNPALHPGGDLLMRGHGPSLQPGTKNTLSTDTNAAKRIDGLWPGGTREPAADCSSRSTPAVPIRADAAPSASAPGHWTTGVAGSSSPGRCLRGRGAGSSIRADIEIARATDLRLTAYFGADANAERSVWLNALRSSTSRAR